jgi:hypothetical protein
VGLDVQSWGMRVRLFKAGDCADEVLRGLSQRGAGMEAVEPTD